ncbi:predicted protein [Plenodomus lingam JN3]|uniref:Uncharacterized protein n=1 Tax=Leptosphaeria maculans (strain JN3 / isolate v23.1.3 / race Av1-4-5-6-7-8) TaxID=985895 RepID=E4ZGZ2_LEPMJ|nr:predicted protein [Plenodomus lingam JN3]CBX90562.1 predicted protein [Plenodomus lingam JN3]
MKLTGLVCSITISRHQSPTEIYGQNQESTPIHHPQFLHHRTPPARCSSCVTETQRLPDTNILNAYRTDHCEQGPGSHFQEQGQQQFRRSARQYHRVASTYPLGKETYATRALADMATPVMDVHDEPSTVVMTL